jgi:menaquinone-dependent protoporphyrinogen IX oxidase
MDNTESRLVVHYSRTGNTERIARELAWRLGAQVESIVDPTERTGLLGYVHSAVDAIQEKVVAIAPINRRAADFSVTVIGTPVWCGKITPAVRAYIERTRDQLRDVALFVTSGNTPVERIAPAVETLLGKKLKASVGFSAEELKDQALVRKKLNAFVAAIEMPAAKGAPAREFEQIA